MQLPICAMSVRSAACRMYVLFPDIFGPVMSVLSFSQEDEVVARANDTLKNNRQNMSVTKQGKGYVARYTEVDASTMTTEIYPGKGPGCEYVGHIVYLEKVYECTGKTISEAKTGTFTTPKARRIRELTRYDGKKWIY